MSSAPDDLEDIDDRLQTLSARSDELRQQCHERSSRRVAQELRRLARSEQRLIPYLLGTFTAMVHGTDLFEPESTRELAVELIALLESPDRARLIQPDLPESEYEYTTQWMTACAYDNLGQSTARMQGYNSDGIHQCISDGIYVCRRTGKLECITCFREYATEVYEAADDLDMALHFARLGAERQVVGPHDRRWVGTQDQGRLYQLQGRLGAAVDMQARALHICTTFHTSLRAYLLSRIYLRESLLLAGREAEFDELVAAALQADEALQEVAAGQEPERGEFPMYDLYRDKVEAIAACLGSEYERAFALLQPWDRLLLQNRDLSQWLDVRLRLIATQRLAGNTKRVTALASQLRERAQQAHDWLTLRRLTRLLDPDLMPSPAALAGDLDQGPFAAHSARPTVAGASESPEPASDAGAATAAESQVAEAAPSPLAAMIQGFQERLQAATDENAGEEFTAVLDQILALPPAAVSAAEDAGWLLYTPRFLIGEGERGRELWVWAQAVVANFPQDANLLSLLAALGAALREVPAAELEDEISLEDLEKLFRQSLELDPEAPGCFARAGTFYMGLERLGDAERCYARGFRLARHNGYLAQRLAEVYEQTDRPRDALAALDMCLREGCQESDVAWQAAIVAGSLEQFDSQLLYLNQFEEWLPNQPWACYYRALALLALERPDEAFEAAEEEARRNADCPFLGLILRACCIGALNQVDEFAELLHEILATRLTEVTYLTSVGFRRLFGQLWKSAACLPDDEPLRLEFEDRLLANGLAPDDFFERLRQRGERTDEINFYRGVAQQRLDQAWPQSSACLPGEEGWASYAVSWGVLARSEDEARELILAMQTRCYPGPVEVVELELSSGGYQDIPGVVWQGYRQGEVPEEGEG